MKRYIAFLFFVFNITLNAQVFNEIEFKGDIDLIAGEFSRDTLLKVCHIEYPPFYKFWKSEPIFTKRDIPKFVDGYESIQIVGVIIEQYKVKNPKDY